jgi:UDP-N-acetylmuramate--alanine ligase
VQYLEKNQTLALNIHRQLKAGDVFLTLGAGDGWKVGLEILERLS